MSENWKIQVSPKLADGTLINLRGEDPEQFAEVIKWATDNAALIVNVSTALQGVPPALAGNVTHTQVTQEPAPQQSYQQPPQQAPAQTGWGQPQQSPPPSFAQAGNGPQGNGPTCRHGSRVYREGVGKASGKPYKAWFCPSQNRQDQCDAEFVR